MRWLVISDERCGASAACANLRCDTDRMARDEKRVMRAVCVCVQVKFARDFYL